MRPYRLAVLTGFALASTALVTVAAAQQRHGGGAPAAAPHIAAPAAPRMAAPSAPHFSAPAAHFAAPAPRISAAPHIAAPHIAAPTARIAPRVASPHIAQPHVAATPHVPHVAAQTPRHADFANGRHGASSFAHRNVERGTTAHAIERGHRNALAPTNHAGPNAGAVVGNAPNAARGRRNAPSTVGQGPSNPTNNALANQGQRPNGRGSRVLSNPVLTNQSARDPAARSLARSTFRGHFEQSAWGRDFDRRHHHFGFVLGFVGPVFWPYAYDDFVDYTLWPSAYDEFWPYAYDDVYEGMFGAYAADDGAAYSEGGATGSSRGAHGRLAARGPAGERGQPQPTICSGDAQGLTDFPVQKIADQVHPDQNQQGLLDQLKTATGKAVQILQAACPTDLPATPTGRLAAMRTRVQAMLQAVQTVRPALEKFYDALNDEQKERFNGLDQEQQTVKAATNASGAQGQRDISQACDSRASSVAGMPIDRIRGSLELNDAQTTALQQLDQASAKAADILKANCSNAQPLTPPGRLAAMEQRLQAMLQAVDTVQPALQEFYGSLSNEQKARFDRLGARPA